MSNHTIYNEKQSTVVWPLGLILAIVPLVVRLREVKLPEVTKAFWDNGSGTYADFFSVNKVILLGILVAIGIALFIREYVQTLPFKGTKLEVKFYNNKVIYGFLGMYTGLAVLSTLFAAKGERYLSLFGAPGRYEGLITILFYVGSMLLAIYISQDPRHIKALYKALTIGAFIAGIIGIGQFLGRDIFQTIRGKTLILPYNYQHLAAQVNFSFGDRRVYGTFFNPNYVGSYGAMLMPLSVVGAIYAYNYEKKMGKKLIATLFALIMAAFWVIPFSRGGLLGGVVALIIIFLFLFKKIITSKGQAFALIGLLIVTAVTANKLSDGIIANRVLGLPKEAAKFFAKNDEPVSQLEEIKLEQDAVEVISNLPPIRVEKEGDTLILKDSGGKVMAVTQDGANIVPEDPNYQGLLVINTLPDRFRIHITNPGKGVYDMTFVPTAEGMRVVGSNEELLAMDKPVEAWGFKGKERLGSSRGYIWSRTFPMIKDTWLLGYGPDTYVVRFPQHDVVGKIIGHGTPRIIVDKPHNLYLQMMVSTGLVSLLAFLGLFITYCVLWIKQMRRTDKDDIRRWMSIGIFAAVCGYLVAGLFNDSVVSVAPVFWILWGLGIGLTGTSLDVGETGKKNSSV